jgi:hypothetical protein
VQTGLLDRLFRSPIREILVGVQHGNVGPKNQVESKLVLGHHALMAFRILPLKVEFSYFLPIGRSTQVIYRKEELDYLTEF